MQILDSAVFVGRELAGRMKIAGSLLLPFAFRGERNRSH